MSDNTKQPENEVLSTQPVDGPGKDVDNASLLTDATSVQAIGFESQPEAIEVGTAPAQLGATRFVHAAFFAGATLSGYLSARIFTSLWNWLAEWPFAVQHLPQLLRLSEDERGSVGSAVGVVIGLITVVYLYRKPTIRSWSEEVAGELTKVTWPDRETVTNGTVIVIVASLVATVYVTLLDRLWGFATRLIYGS
jgi:preprotein translocase subunit SecE